MIQSCAEASKISTNPGGAACIDIVMVFKMCSGKTKVKAPHGLQM